MSGGGGDVQRTEQRVVVTAPTGRDGALLEAMLREAGFETTLCASLPELCAALEQGAGCLLATEETLQQSEPLRAALGGQPAWSSLPVILLAGDLDRVRLAHPWLGELVQLTLLERPVRVVSLRSVVGSALAARRRQYELRDHLLERERQILLLRESEERFQMLANLLPQIVWMADATGQVEFYNQRWYELTGLPPEAGHGDGWQRILPDGDRERTATAWAAAVESGQPFEIEHHLLTEHGALRWHLSRAMPMRGRDDQVVRWFGAATDIHGLKEAEAALRSSEERLQRLVAADLIAIVFFDFQGHVRDANDRFLELTGVTRAELTADPHCLDGMIPEPWQARGAELLEELRAHGQCGPDEFQVQQRGGPRVWVLAGASLLNEGDAVGFLVDISARKRAEEELRAANASLEQRVAERTAEAEQRAQALRDLAAELLRAEDGQRASLAADLHDDLGQLLALARIKLATVRQAAGAELTAPLDELHALLADANRFVRSLTFQLRPPMLDDLGLRPALQWLAEELEQLYGLEVELEADDDFRLDERWRQVVFRAVRELLINVCRHSGCHRAAVRLRRETDTLAVSVSDQGRGFDPALAPSQRGFGLLSVAERMAHLGGQVDICSALGAGTTVTLTLPRHEPSGVLP